MVDDGQDAVTPETLRREVQIVAVPDPILVGLEIVDGADVVLLNEECVPTSSAVLPVLLVEVEDEVVLRGERPDEGADPPRLDPRKSQIDLFDTHPAHGPRLRVRSWAIVYTGSYLTLTPKLLSEA